MILSVLLYFQNLEVKLSKICCNRKQILTKDIKMKYEKLIDKKKVSKISKNKNLIKSQISKMF